MKSIQGEVMSCQTFVELVTEYLEGAMASSQKVCFEQHMYFCDGCVTYLEQIRSTSRIVQAVNPGKDAESSPSTAAMEQLSEAFRKWKASKGL
jgi:hypothetical protein